MSSTEIILLTAGLVVVALLIVVATYLWRRGQLKRRFGPEYDHVVSEKDSRYAAEKELRDRERQHRDLELRPLSDESRKLYSRSWADVQARFVDDPSRAVGEADELVTKLVAERGYPTDDFDTEVAQLSVEHGRTLGHFRDASDINKRNQRGEASTEELRQALVHYRALFADLLGEEGSGDGRTPNINAATLDRYEHDNSRASMHRSGRRK